MHCWDMVGIQCQGYNEKIGKYNVESNNGYICDRGFIGDSSGEGNVEIQVIMGGCWEACWEGRVMGIK